MAIILEAPPLSNAMCSATLLGVAMATGIVYIMPKVRVGLDEEWYRRRDTLADVIRSQNSNGFYQVPRKEEDNRTGSCKIIQGSEF